nr:MAG TPA: hypothetical protein [Bacteriophage sp.]
MLSGSLQLTTRSKWSRSLIYCLSSPIMISILLS